ncbi:MAG: TatD family hydrolase [Oligoflexia bacterium]|nr:TatD family hydrolase [Oligoflexia bacterium]
MSGDLELIDSHCHLNYDYAPKSVDDLVREAAAAGVGTLLTIGTELATIDQVREISERFPNVFHTVGVHPHEAVTLSAADVERLRQAAKHPKCRAIGEIGLDYYYDHSPREIQRDRLERQLALALELGLPVVIHGRDAESDLLAALREYAARVPSGRSPGVIHCFSGTVEFGRACLALGFHISFSGILTFKTAESLREAAREYPLDRLLVETDAPYLAPVPNRGKKCEPAMVRFTAQKLAELKGLSVAEVARATTENARRVFGIPR